MEYKELFETGMSYETFLSIASASEREKIAEITKVISICEEYTNKIKNLDKPYNFLLSAESWCPYVRATIPVLVKMTEINPNINVDTITPDEVMSFSGSQDGIGHLGLALCNDGDLVLLPDPCYPVFMTGSKLGGAEPWYYKLTKENHFLPDVTSIPENVARRAKLMLVSLPANPVGSIGTPELYAEIVNFCRKYDILLVHDNAYSDIIFDGAHGGSIFNTPGAGECAVEFFSLSKSFNVTGARISFLVGRRDVIAACKRLRTQIDFGMFLPIQKVAIAALTGPLDGVQRQCGEYQRRRDALCGGLRGIGWNVPDSHGSMFVWAPLPAGYKTSMEFCLALIDKAGVICTPGSSFGPSGEGYVRFALTMPVEKIGEAVQAIKSSGILG